MKIETINPIRKICMTIGNLPEAYFETLSYYESICWIYKFLNETVIPAVNNNAEALEELQTILNDIKDYIQNYEKDIAEINGKIENLQVGITNNSSAIINLNGKIDNNVRNLQQQINEIEVGEINVYNPLTGQFQNINIVINDLYNIMRDNALTATEFDALDLTATAFDEYEITAYDFDLDGKTILV